MHNEPGNRVRMKAIATHESIQASIAKLAVRPTPCTTAPRRSAAPPTQGGWCSVCCCSPHHTATHLSHRGALASARRTLHVGEDEGHNSTREHRCFRPKGCQAACSVRQVCDVEDRDSDQQQDLVDVPHRSRCRFLVGHMLSCRQGLHVLLHTRHHLPSKPKLKHRSRVQPHA
jgi:hypothetical protein